MTIAGASQWAKEVFLLFRNKECLAICDWKPPFCSFWQSILTFFSKDFKITRTTTKDLQAFTSVCLWMLDG